MVKKNKSGGISLPEFKIYYKLTVTQDSVDWDLGKQNNRTEWSTEMNSLVYGQLFLTKA